MWPSTQENTWASLFSKKQYISVMCSFITQCTSYLKHKLIMVQCLALMTQMSRPGLEPPLCWCWSRASVLLQALHNKWVHFQPTNQIAFSVLLKDTNVKTGSWNTWGRFHKACKHKNLLSTGKSCLAKTGYQSTFNCWDWCRTQANRLLRSIFCLTALRSRDQGLSLMCLTNPP